MPTDFYLLRVLLLTVSGFVNRHQAAVIAYLVEENRILKEQMKGRRVRLTDDQRRRLAAGLRPDSTRGAVARSLGGTPCSSYPQFGRCAV